MKKLKKILRFSAISVIVLVLLITICRVVFNFFWAFDIINLHSYQILYQWWESGGVFKTFRDCSLGVSLLLLPIIWLYISNKLYKQGFWRTVLSPIEKLYHIINRPKNMEVEHISIKNLGVKDKSIEEIIEDKRKIEGKNQSNNMAKNIRKQIAAKMEEI